MQQLQASCFLFLTLPPSPPVTPLPPLPPPSSQTPNPDRPPGSAGGGARPKAQRPRRGSLGWREVLSRASGCASFAELRGFGALTNSLESLKTQHFGDVLLGGFHAIEKFRGCLA